jgi:hypothetical protein
MTTIEKLQYIHDVTTVENGIFGKDNEFESAVEESIKAIENKEKYEKALELCCGFIAAQDICPIEDCQAGQPFGENDDIACCGDKCSPKSFVEYFKKKVGLEVSK